MIRKWRKNTNKKNSDDVVVPKYVTYVIGIVFCMILSSILLAMVSIFLPRVSVDGHVLWYRLPALVLIWFVLSGLTIAYLFVGRFEKIEPANRGLMFFLGDYLPGPFVLGVGDNWVPPFIGVIKIQVNERVTDFPPTADDPGFTVEALSPGDDTTTGGKAQLLMRAAVRWRVIRCRTFYDFTQGKGDEKVEDGTRNIVISGIRHRVAKLTDEQVVASTDYIANGDANNNGVIDDLDEVARPNWGVEIIAVIIPKAQADPDVRAARERQAIEKHEQLAERIENTHVQNLIKKTAEALQLAGMLKPQAAFEAVKLVKVERGKAKEVYVSGGGDFTRGAAVAAALGKTERRDKNR